MTFSFDHRSPESALVDLIWRTRSERANTFVSSASTKWELVFSEHEGKTTVSARGPETRATPADSPPDTEYFGITFKLGTFMPHLSPKAMLDRQDITLPAANDHTFWLQGAAWEIPTYNNVDTFISRLKRKELLVIDPIITATLQGHLPDLSPRSVQRRFVQATGLTYGTVVQIERAQHAVQALERGAAIADVVYQAGYYDQPHLTRSLKRFVGKTPAQIASNQPFG